MEGNGNGLIWDIIQKSIMLIGVTAEIGTGPYI
jgi:hypothetical protein